MQSIEQLELLVHPLKGKSVVYQDGFKRIVTRGTKAVKLSLKFETAPAPSQVNELTDFRIDLMRTNEDSELETVCTLLKFKKTAAKGGLVQPDNGQGNTFLEELPVIKGKS